MFTFIFFIKFKPIFPLPSLYIFTFKGPEKLRLCWLCLLRFNQPIWLFLLPMQLCLYKENSNLRLRYCAWRGNEKRMRGRQLIYCHPTDCKYLAHNKMKQWKKQGLNDRRRLAAPARVTERGGGEMRSNRIVFLKQAVVNLWRDIN